MQLFPSIIRPWLMTNVKVDFHFTGLEFGNHKLLGGELDCILSAGFAKAMGLPLDQVAFVLEEPAVFEIFSTHTDTVITKQIETFVIDPLLETPKIFIHEVRGIIY